MDGFLPVILFFSIIITTFNRGFFSFPSLGILIILYLLLVKYLTGKKESPLTALRQNSKSGFIYHFIFIATYTLFLFNSGGIYQNQIIPAILLSILPVLFLALVFNPRKYFYLLFFLAIVLRLLIIFASPGPVIDVYTMLKEAPLALIRGINPYQAIFSTVYSGVKSDYFTYWPAAFLLQVPFVLAFSDPRILLLVADIVSAWLIYLTGGRSYWAKLFVLIYLYRPNSNFILEQSYLSALEFLLFIAAVYLLSGQRKRLLSAGIFLGLLVAVKMQYIVLLLLFAGKNFKKIWLGVMCSIAVAVLPFVFWNPEAFMSDTLGYFLREGADLAYVPISRSLNLNSLFIVLTGKPVSFPVSLIIFLSVVGVIYYFYRGKSAVKDGNIDINFLQNFILAAILMLMTFYLTGRFAFINYYYFSGSLVILWVLLKIEGNRRY